MSHVHTVQNSSLSNILLYSLTDGLRSEKLSMVDKIVLATGPG